ncbi:MAG: histidinol dehydrogenase, partial [Xanthomonadales bacterium]|nr:histidinol dehydrogenase [Xanthomonadales bacterium]NIX12910.1 histidinol dehydrogenase [Xanthomonadales bacterium]
MMKFYTVEEAQQTILRRKALNRTEYSPITIQRTEDFFGEGVTPPRAVEIILRSVEDEGDQALRQWSQLLDR